MKTKSIPGKAFALVLAAAMSVSTLFGSGMLTASASETAGGTDSDVQVSAEADETLSVQSDEQVSTAAASYDFKGSGTKSNPYQIDSVEAFTAMANLIADGDSNYANGIYYQQTADIDFSEDESVMVGTGTSTSSYSFLTDGEYDGNGYKITGYDYSGTDKFVGMFAGLDGATVKNLTVEGTVNAANSSSYYAGGIAGMLVNEAVIENCTFKGTVTSVSVAAGSYCGGIAGYAKGNSAVQISGCTFDGTINGAQFAGGILGYGGSKTTINDVLSLADVSTSGMNAPYAGGIAGSFGGGTASNGYIATITNAEHEGTITVVSSSSSAANTYGGAGGIIGFTNSVTASATVIENCYHGTGTISYTNGAAVGGVIGWCYTATITNCYSAAESLVTGDSDTYPAGGIIGRIFSTYTPIMTYCYYNGTSASLGYGNLSNSANATDVSGTCAITSASELLTSLNSWVTESNASLGTDTYIAWGIDADENDGYPVLADRLAEDVISLIDAIGTVTLDSEEAITAARTAYDALTEAVQAYVDNIDTLTAAEAELASLQAAAVDALIDLIGSVSLESSDVIQTARDAYDALSSAAAELVTKLDTLEAAEAAYEALVQAAADAAAVEDLIDAIGDVTLDSSAVIEAARTAYDALSETAKGFVDNYETLTEAESTYAELAADAQAQEDAAAVDALIAAIGDVTLDSSEAIEAARTAYDALSDAAKAYVTDLETLTAAETAYAELAAADAQAQEEAAAVDALIAAIGEVTLDSSEAIAAARAAYDALSDAAKAYVTGLDTLTAAETAYTELVAADAQAQKEAAAVDALIAAIGDVTLDSSEAIEAARAAYDALSDAAKAYITGLETLTEAESTYAELVEAYEQALADAAADAQAQEEAAAVDALIAAIGDVTLDSSEAIDAARTAYDALSDAAKAYVTGLDTLTAAESAYAELIAADAQAQEEAAAVDALIAAIGTVTLDSTDAIDAARAAYDALSDAAKAYVTGLDTLAAAETTYAELVEANQDQDDTDNGDGTIGGDTDGGSKSAKKAQVIKIKKKSNKKTIKAKKLKNKKRTFKVKVTVKGKAKVTFKKKSGSKKLKINKKGKVTVKKGTKKGTYKMKVKVTAKATSAYKSKTKVIKVTVKVK